LLWRAISIKIRNYMQLHFNTNQAPYIPWQGKGLKFTSNFHSTQIKHLTFHGEEKRLQITTNFFWTQIEHLAFNPRWEKKLLFLTFFIIKKQCLYMKVCGKNKMCFYNCWPKSLIVWETFALSLWYFFFCCCKVDKFIQTLIASIVANSFKRFDCNPFDY